MTDERNKIHLSDTGVCVLLACMAGIGIIGFLLDGERKTYKLAAEGFADMELRASGMNVNYHSKPEIRDVNHDGINDIVLRRNNGDDMVLYGTRDGNYIFGEKEAGERKY